jgi:two-component system, OmpR family, sensor kinase
MAEARGLPIAAYLGMLVALALAAAFVATLAIVIFLPPRPPDVMRTDVVTDNFEAGYDHMIALGRTVNGRGMIWEVRAEPPEQVDSAPMRATQTQLASALDLRPEQVRIKASNVVQSDVFVFRVRDLEAWTEDAARAAEDAERIAEDVRRAHEDAMRRVEAAREQIRQIEAERARLASTDAERERAVLAAQMRAEAAAARQAAAAERLAARLEQSIRVENGRVIIRRGSDEEMEIETHDLSGLDPEAAAALEALDGMELPDFEVSVVVPPVPPTPDVTSAPPAPPAPRSASAPQTPQVAPAPPLPPMFAPPPEGVVLISGFEIGAQLPDGRWLVMRQGRNWAELGWIARAAGIMGGTLLVLSILALLFARYLTRPIRSFADAVQAVGVNPQSEPVREEGPHELRGAARAVNSMQARLRALIADRTKTLAAVAHDMRTPLMRLRLAAENVPPEQRERMAKEIGEVEALVASFIAFARDDPAEEARVRVDLAALLQSIADDHAEHGRSVSFEGEERVVITGQSLGLKRLFSNLVENALKYGGTARIRLARADGVVIVDVEDDGPGVPADQRESVFEPFVRLNEEGTRGAGLGLAAARSIARAHGGDVAILDAERGALVRVTLPN